MAAIGYGHVAAQTVVNRLRAEQPSGGLVVSSQKPSGESKLGVSLDGVDHVMIKRARCCDPLPGDSVIGYVTRGKGMALHRETCPNVTAYRQTEAERLVKVNWNKSDGEKYTAAIKIDALDRVGLLNDISAIFSETKTNINAAKIKSLPNKMAHLDLTLDVTDLEHLNRVLNTVSRLNDILKIERVTAHSPGKSK
jgi:GTP pyrophosphokinase